MSKTCNGLFSGKQPCPFGTEPVRLDTVYILGDIKKIVDKAMERNIPAALTFRSHIPIASNAGYKPWPFSSHASDTIYDHAHYTKLTIGFHIDHYTPSWEIPDKPYGKFGLMLSEDQVDALNELVQLIPNFE